MRVDLGSHQGDHVDNTLTQSESSSNKKCDYSKANVVMTNVLCRGASDVEKKRKEENKQHNTLLGRPKTLISITMGRVKEE